MAGPERAPGRPRDTAAERRILRATLRLLAADGYARLSLDAVAAEVGVSKPTIYRRWPSKADLAAAAAGTLRLAEPPVDTGSPLGDLTAALENFSRSLMRPNGMSLIGTVLAEEEHTPELLAFFRERLVEPRRAQFRAILVRARQGKLIRPGFDLDCVVSALAGAFYGRYLAASRIPPDFPRTLAAIVWNGVASPGARVSRALRARAESDRTVGDTS